MKPSTPKSKEQRLGDLIQAITRRDPSKRQIKPVNTENLILDDLDDESDDEYIYDGKDDGTEESGSDSNKESEEDGSSETDNSDSEANETSSSASETNQAEKSGLLPQPVLEDEKNYSEINSTVALDEETLAELDGLPAEAEKLIDKKTKVPERICMLCLVDQTNQNDELIECDSCKIVVHEDCHKVYDEVFLSSSSSSSDTDPWFCEPCLAGVENPRCELCPTLGGVFKRTDTNRWVHLLCALYTPGVAFNYSESLTEVTLTELPSREWSSKECSLCDEKLFSWTGVCISCDAGLCKSYFHVTCAQKQGLLAEPAYDDNPSDPFFAHCLQHTDKAVAKSRRRNYLTSINRCRVSLKSALIENNSTISVVPVEEFGRRECEKSRFSILSDRLKRKLDYFRSLYRRMLEKREKPYTRPTKTLLYLENSPIAMRLFVAKAMSLGLPLDLTGSSAIAEASKSIAPGCPVFFPDFISYVIDREKRVEELGKRLAALESTQRELQLADANVSHNYNSLSAKLSEVNSKLTDNRLMAKSLMENLTKIFSKLSSSGALTKLLANVESNQQISEDINLFPTATVTNEGNGNSVGVNPKERNPRFTGRSSVVNRKFLGDSSLTVSTTKGDIPDNTIATSAEASEFHESVIHQCSVCNNVRDQHLMTICETCKRAFHIACLDPPLARVPKQSRLFSWQCSACTKSVINNSEVVTVDVNAPRQLRRVSAPVRSPVEEKPNVLKKLKSAKLAEPALKRSRALSPTGSDMTVNSPIVEVMSTSKPQTISKGRKPRRKSGRRPLRRVEAESYPAEVDSDTPSHSNFAVDDNEDNSSDANSILNLLVADRPISSSKPQENLPSPLPERRNYKRKLSLASSEKSELGSARPMRSPISEPSKLRSSRGSIENLQQFSEPTRQCYVICQDTCNIPKKSPTVNNFKMKIKKIE